MPSQNEIAQEVRWQLLALPAWDRMAVEESLGDLADLYVETSMLIELSGNAGERSYPGFQFDSVRQFDLCPIVVGINVLLNAKDDPWGVASWWCSPNARLEGNRSPAQLLGEGARAHYAILQAALALTEPIG